MKLKNSHCNTQGYKLCLQREKIMWGLGVSHMGMQQQFECISNPVNLYYGIVEKVLG